MGALALLRSAVVWRRVGFEPEHVMGSLAAFALAAAFSAIALVVLRRREAGPGFLAASVAADTLACGLALSTNTLWPQWDHPGLLFMPDLGALILVVGASALRLSAAVSAFGAVLAGAVLAALVGLEAMREPLTPAAIQNLTGIAALIFGVGVVAGVVASRTRRLVREGALRAIDAERVVGNLDWLLRNHHDLRSRLSGAGLNADLLVRTLPADGARLERRLHAEARALRSDLDAVNDRIAEAKRRSHGELLAQKRPEPADPVAVTEGVVSLSRSLVEDRTLALESPVALPAVRVAGGAEGLHHAVAQLLQLASPGARHVSVRLRADAEGRIEIEAAGDRAPGPVPEAVGDRAGVERIALASGGALTTTESGGLRLSLPAAGGAAGAIQPLTQQARAAIGSLAERTRARAERQVAGWRFVLALLSIGRSIWVWQEAGFGLDSPPLRFALGLLAITGAFGVFVAWRARERASLSLLLVSTVLDALLCTGALLTNVVWPEPDYQGILFMPELCALAVPIMVSTLRVSLPLTILSLFLCALGLVGIVGLDLFLLGERSERVFEHLSALMAFQVGMAIIAGVSVVRGRSLVEQSARRGLAAQRAGRNLVQVLDQQRDARGRLGRARERSGRIVASLSRASRRAPEALATAERLRTDLDTVQDALSELELRSYPELLAREEPLPTSVEEALGATVGELAARYPAVRFAADGSVRGVRVRVVGGRDGLLHVMQNLLVNACEGDGRVGARNVRLGVALGDALADEEGAQGAAVLVVRDDGPGFPAGAHGMATGPLATTKAEGSGLGLELVRRLVASSGGSLSLGASPEGGAEVRVSLPSA